MSDKTEKPSPHKLSKAKEKGQVAKSIELNTTLMLGVSLVVLSYLPFAKLLTQSRNLLLLCGHTSITPSTLGALSIHVWHPLIYGLLPLFILPPLVLILTSIGQTGFVFAPIGLKPDLSRINPLKGLKRLFSLKAGFDLIKITIKLLGFSALIGGLFYTNVHEFLEQLTLIQQPNHIRHLVLRFSAYLLLCMLLLGIIDVAWSRFYFQKNLKMSKQELKEEVKSREGCPKVKAKVRQLQWQLRQKSKALSNLKHADVLITNPTHVAVALQYVRKRMSAPKLICKGQGAEVIQMKAIAKKHNIPIIENKPLARALMATTAINQTIDKAYYAMVAPIFKTILASRSAS